MSQFRIQELTSRANQLHPLCMVLFKTLVLQDSLTINFLILWNPDIRYRSHKIFAFGPIPMQMNLVFFYF